MALVRAGERQALSQFSWSAIVAGLFVALGVETVCSALGLGMVFGNGESGEPGFSMGLLIWSGLAWIVAAFLGGYITAWVSDACQYRDGLFHGLVFWGLFTFVLMFLPPSVMGISALAPGSTISPAIISSVAWFVCISGVLSLGTAIWGALIGSRVVEQIEVKPAESYRAA